MEFKFYGLWMRVSQKRGLFTQQIITEHFPGTVLGMGESVVNQDRQGPCPRRIQSRGVSELVKKPISTGHQTTEEMKPGDETEWDEEACHSRQGGQGWPPRVKCDLVLRDVR